MDKNQVMIEYLNTCTSISSRKLFFNYAKGEDETNHFVTEAIDKATQKPYVDGSVMKRYSFTIISYKSIGYRAVDTSDVATDENLEEILEVQEVIDWIIEQSELQNYPDFGTDCLIDDMQCTTDKPVLLGIYTDSVGNPMARYSITIQIDYLDKSKMIWS